MFENSLPHYNRKIPTKIMHINWLCFFFVLVAGGGNF